MPLPVSSFPWWHCPRQNMNINLKAVNRPPPRSVLLQAPAFQDEEEPDSLCPRTSFGRGGWKSPAPALFTRQHLPRLLFIAGSAAPPADRVARRARPGARYQLAFSERRGEPAECRKAPWPLGANKPDFCQSVILWGWQGAELQTAPDFH